MIDVILATKTISMFLDFQRALIFSIWTSRSQGMASKVPNLATIDLLHVNLGL